MEKQTKAARCRTCGAKIIWIKTTSGKSMPCDWRPVYYRKGEPEAGEEAVTLVTPRGEIVRGVQDWTAHDYGYTSHFATCPDANRHRKR